MLRDFGISAGGHLAGLLKPRLTASAIMGSAAFRGMPQREVGGRDCMITVRKILRSLTAAMPGWLVLICGVSLAIPLARLAALLFTAVLCLAQPARVRRAASAWKGGKSHRVRDGFIPSQQDAGSP